VHLLKPSHLPANLVFVLFRKIQQSTDCILEAIWKCVSLDKNDAEALEGSEEGRG